MKVLVLGSLLLQTLNAQNLTESGNGTVTVVDAPAPLLTPGAEADFGASADAAAPSVADFDGLEFPTSTADVLLESSPTPPLSDGVSGVNDTFGGGETPGAAIEMGNLSEFDFPVPTLAPEAAPPLAPAPAPALAPAPAPADSDSPLPKTAVDDPVRNDFDAPSSTSPDEFGLGTPATAIVTTVLPSTLVDALQASASELDDLTAATDDFAEPTDTATTTDSFALPEITDTGSIEQGVGGATTPDDGSLTSDGASAAPPDDGSIDPLNVGSAAPLDDGSATPLGDSSIAPPSVGSAAPLNVGSAASPDDGSVPPDDGSATPLDDGSAAPPDEGSTAPPDDGSAAPSDDGRTAPDTLVGDDMNGSVPLDPSPSPSTDDTTDIMSSATPAPNIAAEPLLSWSGGDTTQYAGQDYGYDDECPRYCLENGDRYDTEDGGDGDTDGYNKDGGGDEAPYLMRLLHRFHRRFHRRQYTPSSNGGFSALQWPGAGKKPTGYEDCEDLPSWMYESTGRKPKPCKKPCPASCYTSTPSPEESSVESSTRSSHYWHPQPTPDPYAETSVSDYYEPDPMPETSSPESAESSPVDDPYSYDTTTTATQTTLVTSVVTGSSPYETGDAGYTGDTLDSICPKQCNPFDPLANECDITTGCTTTGNGKYYCACRSGYRSSAFNANDFSKQFRFGAYVYGTENMVCDELCSDSYCSEVPERPQCQ
jgi:hypothetical protein